MTDNSNRPDPAKNVYPLPPLFEKEIEYELSLIFDPQICLECEQVHSFKNRFEDVKTSIDDLPFYWSTIHKVAIPTAGGKIRI